MKLKVLLMAASLTLSAAAFAQDKPVAPGKTSTPETIEGQVTQVDMSQGKLTVRASDGTIHEFKASPETLGTYKVGDPIKARLRPSPAP